MQSNDDIFCLDPSCFTSLEKLRDAKHFLNEIRKDHPSLKVYVPTIIHKTINYEPEQKFRELPPIVKDWIVKDEPKNITSMNRDTKDEYVFVMREFFHLHSPSPANELIGSIRKIGKESIHLDELINKFGNIQGKILFEMMAISSEFKGKIIAFSEMTFSLMRQIGTQIKRGYSKRKDEWRKRAGIRVAVLVAMLFMDQHHMLDFIQHFQIAGFSFNPVFIPSAGLIVIGNG